MARQPTRVTDPKVIVDADILIWYFRDDEAARRFLVTIPLSERTVPALTVGGKHRKWNQPRDWQKSRLSSIRAPQYPYKLMAEMALHMDQAASAFPC